MKYSVKELKENLVEKVLELGIDPKFKENPAFASVLGRIESLIEDMNMPEKLGNISVKEDGEISFDCIRNSDEKYSFSIFSSSPDEFSCIRTKESRSSADSREKKVDELKAKISDNGFITLTQNDATAYNHNYASENDFVYGKKEFYYISNGIMRDRTEVVFPAVKKVFGNFDRLNAADILSLPRNANINGNNYAIRTKFTRDKLDTARYDYKNMDGTNAHAVIPLSEQYGLREMWPDFDSSKKEIIIPPKSKEEIVAMLQKESNPKVREGLAKLAVGREEYYYNSNEDKDFVWEVLKENGKAK